MRGSISHSLSDENWVRLVRLVYEILDERVGVVDGSRQLWMLADEDGLLSLSSFDWFIQISLDFDKFAAASEPSELPQRMATFGALRREEVFTELRTLLFWLREPHFTLQFSAESFFNGQMSAQEALAWMRWPISDLDLVDKEPYATLYRFADEFNEVPTGEDAGLWHSDLLKRKKRENMEWTNQISKRVKEHCNQIIQHPPHRQY